MSLQVDPTSFGGASFKLQGSIYRMLFTLRDAQKQLRVWLWQPETKGRKDPINIRILQTMVSGIPLTLELRTRMQDPLVSAFFGALANHEPGHGPSLSRRTQQLGVYPLRFPCSRDALPPGGVPPTWIRPGGLHCANNSCHTRWVGPI